MKKVCVIGLGYIGLPTACILSSKGFKVIGVDVNQKLMEELNQGNIDPVEPGLADLANVAIKSGNLVTKTSPEKADGFIICVPTPLTGDQKANLTYVKNAAESILLYLRKNNLVILESTVPPGTTEEILKPILEKSGLKIGKELYLAYCPERVLPGNILKELVDTCVPETAPIAGSLKFDTMLCIAFFSKRASASVIIIISLLGSTDEKALLIASDFPRRSFSIIIFTFSSG